MSRLDPYLLAAVLSLGVGRSPLAAATSPSAAGPCPVSSGPPCTLTLAGHGSPAASAACNSDAWSKLLRFTQPGRWSDADGNGSWETVVEIRLDPTRDCGCARFVVFFDKVVSGWNVHVGNSPTNNGHGGDMGTTPHSAELQLIARQLSVFTAQPPGGQVARLLDLTVPPPAGGVMEFEVCDQALGVDIRPTPRFPEPLTWRLETLNSKLLFYLVPDPERGAIASAGPIWAGFNRVIHLATGAPSNERVGTGVRRVEISLTP